MTDRELIDIITRSLLAIVIALRQKYGLPEYKNISIIVVDKSDV
jgi:hypothetical protein